MELNFNSVEMSREPRAEASSLDYAEAKLTFNSVETIPSLNASAAFFSPSLEQLKGLVDSGKVFKEDVDMVPTIIDKSLSYMPWGGDNMMPYNILKLIEDDETLSTCQQFNAEVCYGSGLKYNTDECGQAVEADILGLRSKAIDIEQRIAEEYISTEQIICSVWRVYGVECRGKTATAGRSFEKYY